MIRIGCSFKPRGCPGSDGMRDTWFNDDTATWIDAWRYTWQTRGRRPPQCPLQHLHLCPGRGGWAENDPWGFLVWVRHVSLVKTGVTSTKAFCQVACRFEVCFLTVCILGS